MQVFLVCATAVIIDKSRQQNDTSPQALSDKNSLSLYIPLLLGFSPMTRQLETSPPPCVYTSYMILPCSWTGWQAVGFTVESSIPHIWADQVSSDGCFMQRCLVPLPLPTKHFRQMHYPLFLWPVQTIFFPIPWNLSLPCWPCSPQADVLIKWSVQLCYFSKLELHPLWIRDTKSNGSILDMARGFN